MATSGNSNFVVTRDDVITRALRLVNGIGQGEVGNADAVTEASIALNMLLKEWQADGMQLWKYSTLFFTMIASTSYYPIGTGATINMTAPLKVLYAFNRNNENPTYPLDTPMLIYTKDEYDRYSSKATPAQPTALYYSPPGATLSTGMVGGIYLLPVPRAADVTHNQIYMTCLFPLEDFDTSTDNPDLPSYYYNALVWGLADQLSSEYGVPLSERGWIQNKAIQHHEKAKSFDIEEGSLYLAPQNRWSTS
jgi:hypothetical protein